MRIRLIILGMLVALCSCKKRQGADPLHDHRELLLPQSEEQTRTTAKIDAGKLLTSAEIEGVLGDPLKEPVPSYRSESGFEISQCYFGLPTPSKSIVVTVTQRGSGNDAKDPREFWMEKFHSEAKRHDRDAGEEESEEHPRVKPLRIEGLGDEAYWLEAGQMGALYVLRGNLFLRVAVGGSDSKDARISKSKRLAEMALSRL